MPKQGLRWRHCVLSTYASWHHGDPRGFRTKRHRRHSSGDYKSPPPEGEHAGLHEYSKRNSGPKVVLKPELFATVGRAMQAKLEKKGLRVVAIAIGPERSHVLVELPDAIARVRAIMGECKAASSHAIRDTLPGRVWADGGKFKPVDDPEHHRRTHQYIWDHYDEGCWVWSHKWGERGPKGVEPPAPKSS
jgi:REP element-mobilizing transposase RayT